MKINRHVSSIENEVQDRTSDAWKAMCKYVDELADSGAEEFSPREALGAEHFVNIHTLPESVVVNKDVASSHAASLNFSG